MSLVLLLFGMNRMKLNYIEQFRRCTGLQNVHFGLRNSTDRTISSSNICRNSTCQYMDIVNAITTIYSIVGRNWMLYPAKGQKTSALIALNCRLDCLLCPKKVKRKVAPCFKNFGAIWKKCKWSMRANSRCPGSGADAHDLHRTGCYHYETVVVQPTEIQKAMVQSLSERAGKVHSLRRFPTGSEMHASFS